MKAMQILQPPGWPRPRGYANGVAARGTTVFVAGLIGWNASGTIESDDFADQVAAGARERRRRAREAGAGPEHLVRMTWYVTDKREYVARARELGAAFASSSAATIRR